MPRLTTKHYLLAHHYLRDLWLEDESIFAQLSPQEQWDLHDYFVPDMVWTNQDLTAHRREVSHLDPSLPQRAGRAFAKIQRATAGEAVTVPFVHVTPAKGQRREYAVSVRPLVKPKPDVARLARVLLDFAAQSKVRPTESRRSKQR